MAAAGACRTGVLTQRRPEMFSIDFSERASDAIEELPTFRQRQITDGIATHLTHEPRRESRSRIKRLRQPAISEYRLRVGDYRVFYNVNDGSRVVLVVTVWWKGRRTLGEVDDGADPGP